MRIPENTETKIDPKMDPVKEARTKPQSGQRRRKGWGLLAYYLAGGSEQRHQYDRRYDSDLAEPHNKRDNRDRRHVVDTKYLNYGKVINRREDVRRSNERVDETAAEQNRYSRLGPGWL